MIFLYFGAKGPEASTKTNLEEWIVIITFVGLLGNVAERRTCGSDPWIGRHERSFFTSDVDVPWHWCCCRR